MFRREKMPKSSRGKRTKRENELGGRICQYPKREKMPKFQRGTLFQGDIMPKSPRGRGFKRELLPKCLRGDCSGGRLFQRVYLSSSPRGRKCQGGKDAGGESEC